MKTYGARLRVRVQLRQTNFKFEGFGDPLYTPRLCGRCKLFRHEVRHAQQEIHEDDWKPWVALGFRK